MPRTVAPALLLVASLVLTDSLEAAPLRVAIVRPARHSQRVSEAIVRLAAEIRDAGFEPVVVAAKPGEEAREQVEGARIEPRPFATIAIVPTGRDVVADVWVADHLSAKTTVRRVDTANSSSEEAPRTLAIRAVELLKASLLELGRPAGKGTPALPEEVARWMRDAGAPAPAASVAATVGSATAAPSASPPLAAASRASPAAPEVARASDTPASDTPASDTPASDTPASDTPASDTPASHVPQRPWHAFAAEPTTEAVAAWLFATGGLDTRALVARVGLPLDEAWSMRLSLTETLPDAVVTNAAGTVRIRQEVALTELALAAWNRSGRFVPVGTLGFGAYHLHLESRARPPFESRTGDAWAFALSASLGLAVRLADSFAVVGEISAIAITPRVRVQILEETPVGTGAVLLRPGVALWASF